MDRLKEPSTWAGVAAFLGALAGVLPGYYSLAALALSAGASALAVRLPEGVTAREAAEVAAAAARAAVEADRKRREPAQVPGA
jgi:hypothetical protein